MLISRICFKPAKVENSLCIEVKPEHLFLWDECELELCEYVVDWLKHHNMFDKRLKWRIGNWSIDAYQYFIFFDNPKDATLFKLRWS